MTERGHKKNAGNFSITRAASRLNLTWLSPRSGHRHLSWKGERKDGDANVVGHNEYKLSMRDAAYVISVARVTQACKGRGWV